MIDLELDFSTTNSYIFKMKDNTLRSGVAADVHIHIGTYHVMHIHVNIRDVDIKSKSDVFEGKLDYIDSLLFELDMQLCRIFGLLEKTYKIETHLSINFNYIRINFAPYYFSDESLESFKESIQNNIAENLEN